MANLFSKNRVISCAIVTYILLAPIGLSVTASAQQNNNINGLTRVEKAEIRQEFNSKPVIPSSVMDPYLRGVELFKAKDYLAAEKNFRQVLRFKSQHAKTNYYMGAIFAERDQHKQAIKHYKKSLKGYKSNPIIQANLGVSYAKIDKREKAESILAKLKKEANSCNNTCANSNMIADAIHVLSEALYTA